MTTTADATNDHGGTDTTSVAAITAWIAEDPDPRCQAELQALLDAGDHGELADRFRGSLHFGTAGIRGPLGAGPTRINVATVRGTSAGLAAYLLASVPGATVAGVVIGCDARHGSDRFANETAMVLSGAGFRVLRLPPQLPTPVLAFAVRHLSCAAGVMITASHNPPGDNGYKVYMADGAQIVPPVDEAISAAVAAIGPLRQVPLGGPGEALGSSIVDAYIDAVLAALPPSDAHDINTVYTPMHGVGRNVLLTAFDRAGFPVPSVVSLQGEPDADFPTLPKPNPEQPGALDLAITQARTLGADLVLANDPDADRLAVAIPCETGPVGWRRLHGDEVGALLGEYLLAQVGEPQHTTVATTIVSSGLLGRMAIAAEAKYIETLTGFKWIMHETANQLGMRFLFGYEEALGYAVNDVVRDKDGISAALLMASIAAETKRRGRTIADRLDDIARRFGVYATAQLSIDLPGETGRERIRHVMAVLRTSPPTTLLDRPVTEVDDGSIGIRRDAGGHEEALSLPRSDVLTWRSGEQIRVVVRPSGTEPKLKVYLQVVLPVGDGDDLDTVTTRAADDLSRLEGELRAVIGPE